MSAEFSVVSPATDAGASPADAPALSLLGPLASHQTELAVALVALGAALVPAATDVASFAAVRLTEHDDEGDET